MKKLILAAALIAGGCSYAMAQAGSSGGQGTSASPSMTQDPKQGSMREDNPAKKTKRVAKTKKKAKKKM